MKRRKKACLISMLVVMIMLVSQSIAYAESTWESSAKDIDIVQEYSNGKMARLNGMPRGSLISSFEVSITDRGNGTVGLFGSILCHEPMREVRMNLYLEVWDAEHSAWAKVETYKYTWVAAEMQEDLTAAVVSFDVDGLERGRDYRLRGIAGAYNLENTLQEAWRADSQSIQVQSLDNYATE
ncbi:MAG: hypothetical protein Q4F28_10930 [Eubacteriales bacterium]|nr:hypothetical protein [Eubacteriales bacterium]